MGTANSKPSANALGDASPQQPKQPSGDAGAVAPCPLGFDKMLGTSDDDTGDSAPSPSADATAGTMPSSHPPTSGSSASCPVHKLLPGGGGSSASGSGGAAAAAAAPSGDAPASASSSSCPVKEENRSKVSKYLHPHKYNVYSQRIDDKGLNPTNNMPANPNQQPAPGQEKPLSTARVPSTIPKGGEESTWTYPSPQMFWNALMRKGKAEDTGEEDMDVVVSIHNNMNERTWKKILEWEKIRSRGGGGEGDGGGEGSEPRLLRFLGRPDDTAPKALAKMMLGHPLPFDRHDWVVDRGGDERRYVIDYYYDDGAVDEDGMPALHAEGAVKSIKVDVRPALDSFRDLADRLVQMPLARLTGKSEFVPLSLRPSPTMKAREPWAKLRTKKGLPSSTPLPGTASESERDSAAAAAGGSASLGPDTTAAERDARAMARAEKKCAKKFDLLREAESAGDALRAEAAALSLEYCTARYLCKKEARAYKQALECAGPSGSIIGNDPAHAYWAESALDKRLGEMRGALTAFAQRQLEARRRQSEDK